MIYQKIPDLSAKMKLYEYIYEVYVILDCYISTFLVRVYSFMSDTISIADCSYLCSQASYLVIYLTFPSYIYIYIYAYISYERL